MKNFNQWLKTSGKVFRHAFASNYVLEEWKRKIYSVFVYLLALWWAIFTIHVATHASSDKFIIFIIILSVLEQHARKLNC